nr:probable LRR receptor-like serine/threonine-protein kinase At1g67720 [Tanacetum cinerariifolium]
MTASGVISDVVSTEVSGSNEILASMLSNMWDRNILMLKSLVDKVNLDNSTSNVLILLDSWTSELLVYKEPLSGKWDNEDIHNLRSIKSEFPTIVFNNKVPSETLSCEPTVSSLNDEADFRISFDDFDDEEYTVIFDKNSFSYKIIYVNDLKTDLKNDNNIVNMPLLPLPKPTVSYFDDLDSFKDFENEYPAIIYNDSLTSKSNFLTEPTISSQHIDEFNLKDETSLSECDEKEQNILIFNGLCPFNVIYLNDSKSGKDNDEDKVDIEHFSRDLSVKPLPDVINMNVGAYAQSYTGNENLHKGSSRGRHNTCIILGLSVGAAALLIGFIISFLLLCKREEDHKQEPQASFHVTSKNNATSDGA